MLARPVLKFNPFGSIVSNQMAIAFLRLGTGREIAERSMRNFCERVPVGFSSFT